MSTLTANRRAADAEVVYEPTTRTTVSAAKA
jgi:hypothetical protein